MLESPQGEDAEHFAEVRTLLDAAGVAYVIDPTLVRGLDYYTRTIFSFVCDALGAQSEIGGGGRYDGLIEQLGGPPTPAVGWAAGIERILLALDEEEPRPGRDAFVAIADDPQRAAGDGAGGRAPPRRPGGRDRPRRARLKGQLKHADRIGAAHVLILEADGIDPAARHDDRRAAPGRAADVLDALRGSGSRAVRRERTGRKAMKDWRAISTNSPR